MSRFDVIVIGELNVDLLLNDIALLPTVGKEIIANQMKLALGSSSAIFASNLSTLGLKVAFLGKVGRMISALSAWDALRQKMWIPLC